jgi:hypothetical protein
MLEIIAIATLAILIACTAAALYGFAKLEALIAESHAAAARTEFRVSEALATIAQTQREGTSELLEAIKQLPQRGKPGRKPGSSTGAKRGPKPKTVPTLQVVEQPRLDLSDVPAPLAPPASS